MTAAELIARLQQMPADAPVYVLPRGDVSPIVIPVSGADRVQSRYLGEAVVIELEDDHGQPVQTRPGDAGADG